MKVIRDTCMIHPILVGVVQRVQTEIIDRHNTPMRLFETGRSHERHQSLLTKGVTHNLLSSHLYDLTRTPPLYATAVKYAYFDERWSWNLRDSTTAAWYVVFGNMVMDLCPEVIWGGLRRKSTNLSHFELRSSVIEANMDKYPCVLRR